MEIRDNEHSSRITGFPVHLVPDYRIIGYTSSVSDFLDKILAHKRTLLNKRRPFLDTLVKKMNGEQINRYYLFKKAIYKPGKMNLIAEVKKASPSKGVIRKDFNAVALANIYVKNGADALSVLTEDKFFLGKPDYIKKIASDLDVPILMKDFFIDETQIYEAFYVGASAILLIVAILDDKTLKKLLKLAHNLAFDCLVEIHNEKELERALKAGAEIIGINNRDLHTFKVDLKVSERIIPQIPKEKVIVVESGITNHQEVQALQSLGANAVLIGETFMKAPDVVSKMKEVMEGKS